MYLKVEFTAENEFLTNFVENVFVILVTLLFVGECFPSPNSVVEHQENRVLLIITNFHISFLK